MIGDYFFLSFSNLRHKGLRSWLTILGILIGITSVVALISLGDGLRATINAQFGVSSTEVITIQAGGLSGFGPPGSGVSRPLTINDLEKIERLSNIDFVIRRNIPSGKLEFNDKLIFGFALNIPQGEKRKFVYDQLELEAESGRLLKDGDENKVVLAHNFYVDKVGLDKEVLVGNKIIIQEKTFEVVGIAKKSGSFIFDNVVYMNEEPLQDLFKYGDKIDIIVVKVKDKDLIQKTKEDIEKSLRKSRNVDVGEEDFEVSTPDAALASVNSILTGVQIFIFLVASISIFVGGIGIINTMTTSVLERKKEIGIMKSIGARNEQIFVLFFIESGLMGLIGGILGITFGLIIGMIGINAISGFIGSEIKMTFNFALIISALVGSFLIGSAAGITPAMQAAKQNPIDALK